jgi:hypothetical protein
MPKHALTQHTVHIKKHPLHKTHKRPLLKKPKKKMNCSPFVKGKTASENTCYTKDILFKIRDAYNNTHIHSQITKNPPIHTNNPDEIISELTERLNCEKEDCWLKETLKQNHIELDKLIFAPDKPDEWKINPNEWLSNFDIADVLRQYEKSNSYFKFIGPTPIDFDYKKSTNVCVWDELCNFSLDDYIKKQITDIGIIFNLDKHTGRGTHWVSMYINIPDKLIFYYDSASNRTPTEIKNLVKRIQEMSKNSNFIHSINLNTKQSRKKHHQPSIGFKYIENYPNQHQQSNTECGMYSLYFIITMLDKSISLNRKIKMFKYDKIKDKSVEKLRNIYFNEK